VISFVLALVVGFADHERQKKTSSGPWPRPPLANSPAVSKFYSRVF
jgi:hypothetical protein